MITITNLQYDAETNTQVVHVHIAVGDTFYNWVVGNLAPEWSRQRIQNYLDTNAARLTADAALRGNVVTAEERVQLLADNNAAGIPGWSNWAEDEALDWWQENIKDTLDQIPGGDLSGLTLEQLRMVIAAQRDVMIAMSQELRALSRLSIALRDRQWPNLSGDNS